MRSRLFQEVTDLSKLPSELISNELETVLKKVGASSADLSIDQLRQAMLLYLEEVMGPEESTEEV